MLQWEHRGVGNHDDGWDSHWGQGPRVQWLETRLLHLPGRPCPSCKTRPVGFLPRTSLDNAHHESAPVVLPRGSRHGVRPLHASEAAAERWENSHQPPVQAGGGLCGHFLFRIRAGGVEPDRWGRPARVRDPTPDTAAGQHAPRPSRPDGQGLVSLGSRVRTRGGDPNAGYPQPEMWSGRIGQPYRETTPRVG